MPFSGAAVDNIIYVLLQIYDLSLPVCLEFFFLPANNLTPEMNLS